MLLILYFIYSLSGEYDAYEILKILEKGEMSEMEELFERNQEQIRNYMLLLRQMGYTTEGHIIYVALNKIHTIQ